MMSEKKFVKSQKMLERALKTIPLGTQTFTKSYLQFPKGIAPHFIERAQGAYVWDVDGNKYVDFVNSLLSISLGYNDVDVKNAVIEQLDKGTIFSLSSELEVQVSEAICDMVPCAEMVRFGKNGSDATAGAIRLARAYTQKEYVLVCGYHGWQDWYIGSTSRDLGVPEGTKQLTKTFQYNDIDSLSKLLDEFKGKVAAVILEPMNLFEPKDNFLNRVKELTHEHGALLVFDETITGFRFANGGAQELYDVIPDLATFGKGLANGYPLSAIVGKKEIMKEMENIFFSFTFGGDAISLAATKAVLHKLKTEPILKTINKFGTQLIQQLNEMIVSFDFQEFFKVCGNPAWSFFVINDSSKYELNIVKSFYIQEMIQNDILTFGTHNMSYSHGEEELSLLMNSYKSFFQKFEDAIKTNSFESLLLGDPIQSVFKVR